MILEKNRLQQLFIYSLLHLLLLTLVYIVFRLVAHETILPLVEELDKWDGSWYQSIVKFGYQFQEGAKSNVAFFPLFPYLWKGLHADHYGISLLNWFFFYLGFGVLAYAYKFPAKRMLLYLSVPSFMFMYVPYTEALFFLFSVLLLLALRNKNTAAVCFCLVVCSFIRPVATVFLPALIIMEILSSYSQTRKTTVTNILFFLGSVLLGLGCVMLIQYLQTGTALGFFYSQQAWQHYFRLPNLPFTSSNYAMSKVIDGAALLVGCIAAATLWKWLTLWLKKQTPQPDKALIFSALYLFGITLAIVFFQGGGLQSLNRYFFSTAFFILFLDHFLNTYVLRNKHLKWIVLGLLIFWLPVGSYQKLPAFLTYAALTVYVILYLFLHSENKRSANLSFWLLYFINIFFQIFLLQMFFHSQWVG